MVTDHLDLLRETIHAQDAPCVSGTGAEEQHSADHVVIYDQPVTLLNIVSHLICSYFVDFSSVGPNCAENEPPPIAVSAGGFQGQ